jgi:hypothetical protein
MAHVWNAHSSFTHDSINDLGYDWERIANPSIPPKYPFKVYWPRSTEDVVAAVKETAQLGQRLMIRSMGHSSNDLVLVDKSCTLCTQHLDQILEIDQGASTVVVQAGVVLAQLDEHLMPYGLGLPVIGDHNAITAGGFASVGGISPASHRQGMFIDNVLELEYVAHDGTVVHASRAQSPDLLDRILAGTGQFGVITKLKLRLLRLDKFKTVLHNQRQLFADVASFVAQAAEHIQNPGNAVMERGLWADFPVGTKSLTIGQFSSYQPTQQNLLKTLANDVTYGALHGIGFFNGKLPLPVEVALKYLGMVGIVLSPHYATIKNIETFTDKTLDESVGDPSRMLIALAPASQFASLFRALYQLCLTVREKTGGITFITIYVKAITSPYLTRASGNERHCELMLYLGLDAERMTDDVLQQLVSDMDDLCISKGAFRYMHSKTVKDKRRQLIDANAVHAAKAGKAADGLPSSVSVNA